MFKMIFTKVNLLKEQNDLIAALYSLFQNIGPDIDLLAIIPNELKERYKNNKMTRSEQHKQVLIYFLTKVDKSLEFDEEMRTKEEQEMIEDQLKSYKAKQNEIISLQLQRKKFLEMIEDVPMEEVEHFGEVESTDKDSKYTWF